MSDAYSKLLERMKDLGRLDAIEALLDWDQQVNMPPGGVEGRAEQLSLIAGLAHEWKTSDEVSQLLSEAKSNNGDFAATTNIREMARTFDRASRIPTELVKKIAHTTALAQNAWQTARAESDFAKFAPWLTQLLDLKRQEAEHIGYETEAYDALMDAFEPGAKSADVEALFKSLREATVPLVKAIAEAPNPPDSAILTRHYSRAAQQTLSRAVAELLNFDFNQGRTDVSVHPFFTTIVPSSDVRLTSRYEENFLPAGMFGTMHEVGHGLYEQGLLKEHMFTPMGSAVSLGIHESQSRMWENMVGRSRAFWDFYYSHVQKTFPDVLGSVALDDFYRAVNTVSPSLIRVEADEVTYNLHIVLRFELEREMLSGRLQVKDVPTAWNEKMRDMIGIVPPDDARGCLQDVHWSIGTFGYFPTYAMGNLYAAQFFEKAQADLPDLHDCIRRGELRPLLDWLRENIHRHGQRYRAGELVERVTGRPLSIEPFVNYVTKKFEAVYGLS